MNVQYQRPKLTSQMVRWFKTRFNNRVCARAHDTIIKPSLSNDSKLAHAPVLRQMVDVKKQLSIGSAFNILKTELLRCSCTEVH